MLQKNTVLPGRVFVRKSAVMEKFSDPAGKIYKPC